MRVLISGSQTWKDEQRVFDVLNEYRGPDAVLVSGHCPRGLDYIAEKIWRELFHLPVEEHKPDWSKFGKRAGYVRNQEMVDTKPDICLVWLDWCHRRDCKKPKPHYSHGASHTARRAEAAGIPVRRFKVGARSERSHPL